MNKFASLLIILYITLVPSLVYSGSSPAHPKPQIDDVSQTVLRVPLKQGVSVEKAVKAMISKAADLKMDVIAHQKISAQLYSRGIQSRHLEVLQLCRIEDAGKAIELNVLFAVYIPCSIALVEDGNGQIWILVRNIDFQVNNRLMEPASVELAIRINQDMLSIVTAGVNGSF